MFDAFVSGCVIADESPAGVSFRFMLTDGTDEGMLPGCELTCGFGCVTSIDGGSLRWMPAKGAVDGISLGDVLPNVFSDGKLLGRLLGYSVSTGAEDGFLLG